MIHSLIVFIAFFQFAAQATVYTDTHAYILDQKTSTLLAVNRRTNDEKTINVGKQPTSFQINGSYGYCVDEGHGVRVIDLYTNQVVRIITINCKGPLIIHDDHAFVFNNSLISITIINLTNFNISHLLIDSPPDQFIAHNGFGYISNRSSSLIYVIDLKEKKGVESLCVGRGVTYITFHQGEGYIFFASGYFIVVDLETRRMIANDCVNDSPYKMIIKDNLGYAIHHNSCFVSIIDLEKHCIGSPINISHNYSDFYINDNLGWLVSNGGYVELFDLNTLEVRSLSFEVPSSIVFNESYAYIACKGNMEYAVVNLSDLSVVQTIENPNKETLSFTDFYLYLGLKRLGLVKSKNNLLHKALKLGNIEMAATHLQGAGNEEVSEAATKINLELGELSQLIDSTFNPFDFLFVEPQTDLIIEDLWCDLSESDTSICHFIRTKVEEKKDVWMMFFKQALQCNDPYARAVMYVAFKNGLLGTKGLGRVDI